jgi:peptidylamidoglycolate lyase
MNKNLLVFILIIFILFCYLFFAMPKGSEVTLAAVGGQIGGQDHTGPYEVDPNWPLPLSDFDNHAGWTWGAMQGIFAESENRVFLIMRGELPELERPREVPYPEVGPSLSYPVTGTPFRNASVGPITSPGNTGPDGWSEWQGTLGVDARWEHIIVVVNSRGEIIEDWSQWDHLFRRPHSITINPYDPEKHIWVIDDRHHVIYEFSNDGSELLRTMGEPGVPGNDANHFNRPTFMTWAPDGTMFVADGYANSRIVKFSSDGEYITSWGQEGIPPNETRPGYFNAVHGVVLDYASDRLFVTDRSNRRIQVFNMDGNFLYDFSTGPYSVPQYLYISEDRYLWVADYATNKILKYSLDGQYLYSWGSMGEWPGGMWNVHGMSVDENNNLYIAEVNSGRAQKFIPRQDARMEFITAKPLIE